MATSAERVARLESSIEAQAKKLADLRAKKSRLAAIERNKAAAAERKLETRRLVLLGAYVMARLQATGKTPAQLSMSGVSFDSWLERPAERELFGLGERAAQPVSPTSRTELNL